MDFKKQIMDIWRGRGVKVVWQPRLEYWYKGNRNRGRLPSKYEGKDLLEIYDDLGASVRYYTPYYGSSFLDISYKNVEIYTEVNQAGSPMSKGEINVSCVYENTRQVEKIKKVYKTPLGKLREEKKVSKWGETCHIVEYPVKKEDDIDIMEYILNHMEVKFNYELYREAESQLGTRGIIQFFFPRSPLARLVIDYMGLERTILNLYHHRSRMEEFISTIDNSDSKIYDVLENCPVDVVNFGENIDQNLFTPPLFEQYLAPYYEKRIGQLHRKGKYCHLHVDGSFKQLIPYLRGSSFDGLEALTPKPQGDVSLKEMQYAVGEDKVLLDGIPAIFFLEDYPVEKLKDYTCRILEMFSPNLILGISDELPPGADIERVRLVSEIVDDFNKES